MLELLQETIKGYNLPFTILLGIVLLYWIIALMGFVDLDSGDADVEIDADVDGDLDGSPHNSAFTDAIRFLGFSDAPLMMVLSLFIIVLWMMNIIANLLFNPEGSGGWATILLIPVLVVALVLTRLLVRPLRPLMNMLRGVEPPAKIIGEQGVVISASLTEKFGRVEVDFEGKPLLLNAVASEGSGEISKGKAVLIVSKRDSDGKFVVRPL